MKEISGWGISDQAIPCWWLRGPWVNMFGGQVRDYRGPFLTEDAAKAGRVGITASWEIEPGYTEQRQCWRNYADGSPVTLVPKLEDDAAKHGYTVEWVSTAWAKAMLA